jgi:hypothetical protein
MPRRPLKSAEELREGNRRRQSEYQKRLRERRAKEKAAAFEKAKEAYKEAELEAQTLEVEM